MASSYACFAQGEIRSGEAPTGAISPVGDVDSWTFSANAGDSVLIGAGKLSGGGVGAGSGFKPRIRAFRPDGMLVATHDPYASQTTARVEFTASQSGTYIINVDDGGGYHDDTGTYQLFLAKAPGSFVVPAGDDGGALISGTHPTGTIKLGDLDLWSFVAPAGSSITLSIGKLTDDGVGGGFRPSIRLYRPDGSIYASQSGPTNAQVLINSADQSGTYTVVISCGGNGADGSGTYQLNYIRSLDPPSPKVLNISTRMKVETGDNVLIAGFIVTGSAPKKVLIRGLGPSLPVNGKLLDPTLSLDGGAVTNDNWRSTQAAEIIATTIPPASDLESAIVATLSPGAHTVILSGKNNGTGVGLVEVYDLERTAPAQLANISTRGFVQTDENVMIAGFIIGGDYPVRVIVRATGPSLPVGGKLLDPTLELVDSQGHTMSNDDWRTTQESEIVATTLAPTNEKESAIVATLIPGSYTVIVRGKDNTTGVALVEGYVLQ